MNERQDLRVFPFTCPTCGQEKCQLVFSHPFDPSAPKVALGITHEDDKTGKNDPMGFVTCGLTVDIDRVKQIDGYIVRGEDVPASAMEGVVKGKAEL